ncbi:hypothetical protein D3C79_615170 [compost metagenome]
MVDLAQIGGDRLLWHVGLYGVGLGEIGVQGLLGQQTVVLQATSGSAVAGLLLPVFAGGCDDQQMACQVATVNRRDIGGFQG